jgi:hypothetical protein
MDVISIVKSIYLIPSTKNSMCKIEQNIWFDNIMVKLMVRINARFNGVCFLLKEV